MTTNNIVHCS